MQEQQIEREKISSNSLKTMPASTFPKRPSLPLFPLGPSPLKMLLFIVLPLLLSLICLPNSVDSKPQHRHRRHHHHHNRRSSDHFMFKDVLKNCSVPPQCRDSVMRALEFQERVPECDSVDYFDLLFCLDREIMSRTNVTYLNSMAGRNCCDEYVEDVSSFCRQACRSALFAPTMGHEQKQKQLEMVCDRRHGDEKRGDSGLLNCLATQQDWLEKKHKVMMRR